MTTTANPLPGTDEEMEQRIAPLVNEIFERFNQEQISPSEAGMVTLALVYRIMEVLQEAPEARRFFVLTLINVVNNFLAEEMEEGDQSSCGAPGTGSPVPE